MNTEPLWFLDTLVVPRVPASHSPDGLSVLESRARRGDSPPLHTHSEDELFVVLDGELLVKAGAEERTLRAGETLLGPRGVPHTYLVTSDEARWLRHRSRDLANGERRGVRGEQGSPRRCALDVREQTLLDPEILDDSLDDNVGIGKSRAELWLRAQPLVDLTLVFLGELAVAYHVGEEHGFNLLG